MFSANAVQQYTEAQCILFTHQISDEKRKFASNNAEFYSQTQKNFDTYCKNLILVSKKAPIDSVNSATLAPKTEKHYIAISP
jgi:hypothetical protein